MTKMSFVTTDNAPAPIGPYSPGIVAGPLMYLSGQTPLRADGSLVEGDAVLQTHQVFQNLQNVLAAAGLTFADVVKATVFLTDMDDFSAVNEVYASYFGDHRPARTTVQVTRLPRDARVEIEMVAWYSK